MGTDIAGPGTIFRTIDNKLRDPEDRAGEGHIDGTILAGSLWDMRNLLGNVDLADSLFHFARYGRPYSFEDYYIELGMYRLGRGDGPRWHATPLVEEFRRLVADPAAAVGPLGPGAMAPAMDAVPGS